MPAAAEDQLRSGAVRFLVLRARDSLFGEPEFAVAAARGWRGPARFYGGRVLRGVQHRLRRAR